MCGESGGRGSAGRPARGRAVVLGSGSVESGPVVLVEVVRWWAQFLHAIGLGRVVEWVSGQTVKGFTYVVLCT